MKKEIKPSPLMMIIFGVLAVLCVGISVAESDTVDDIVDKISEKIEEMKESLEK